MGLSLDKFSGKFIIGNIVSSRLITPVLTLVSENDGSIDISWTIQAGALGYTIKYGTESGVYTEEIDAGNSSYRTITGLVNGTVYYFMVVAYNTAGEGEASNEVSATPDVLPIGDTPVLALVSEDDTMVKLSWNLVSGATGYKVKYGTATGVYTQTIDVENVSYKNVTGLVNNTPYFFVVVPYNANGDGDNSNEITGTPVEVIGETIYSGGSVLNYWNQQSTPFLSLPIVPDYDINNYAIHRGIRCGLKGTLRISFTMTTSGWGCGAIIVRLRDGVKTFVGTNRIIGGGSSIFTEDISGWEYNDTIAIFGCRGSSYTNASTVDIKISTDKIILGEYFGGFFRNAHLST